MLPEIEYVKELGKMFQNFVCFFCLKNEYLGVNSNLAVQKMVGDFYIFSVFYVWVIITVRYHDDESKKLNACISLLSHMVYL